jgi:hypothetical protein
MNIHLKYLIENARIKLIDILDEEQLRSPKGGITIKGKFFPGGQFIPKEGGYAKEFKKMKDGEKPDVTINKKSKDKSTVTNIISRVNNIRNKLMERTEQENKHSVVTNLSKKMKVEYDKVNELVHNWAVTSADHYPDSLGLQYIAKDIFGVGKTSHFQSDKIIRNKVMENFVKTVYDETQNWFKEQGYKPDDEIILFRGVDYKIKSGKYALQPLSSFSLEIRTAKDFTGNEGTVFGTKIPVKNIFSIPLTGIGCTKETEAVVIGHDIDAHVIKKVVVKNPKDFNKINMFDSVNINTNIKSLKGCPDKIYGDFECSENDNIKSLEGISEYIGGDLICTNNKNLKVLNSNIKEVGGKFGCVNNKNLTSLKGMPEIIMGHFICNHNENLTSLEGCPEEIGGYFDCSALDKLKSLKGGPKKINGSFYCSSNKNLENLEGAPNEVNDGFYCTDNYRLKSLKGAPQKVKLIFSCQNNANLLSLEGAPKKVEGSFVCRWNPKIKTLKGSPVEVEEDFECSNNDRLESLDGCPKKVGNDFICNNNNSLKSLVGAPEVINGYFDCSENKNLKSLKGCPKVVNGDFYCDDIFTEKEIRKICKVKGDIIRRKTKRR